VEKKDKKKQNTNKTNTHKLNQYTQTNYTRAPATQYQRFTSEETKDIQKQNMNTLVFLGKKKQTLQHTATHCNTLQRIVLQCVDDFFQCDAVYSCFFWEKRHTKRNMKKL